MGVVVVINNQISCVVNSVDSFDDVVQPHCTGRDVLVLYIVLRTRCHLKNQIFLVVGVVAPWFVAESVNDRRRILKIYGCFCGDDGGGFGEAVVLKFCKVSLFYKLLNAVWNSLRIVRQWQNYGFVCSSV